MADLHTLMQNMCFLKCNPSNLQRGLVQGGRNKEKHTEKMEAFKMDCLTGCSFAAVVDKSKDTAAQSRFTAWAKESSTAHEEILTSEEVDKERQALMKWFNNLRENCSDACETKCKERPGDAEFKCMRACSSGCDYFFDIIMEN